MVATRRKLLMDQKRCSRCQRDVPPIHECSFSFKETYAYWKALWQERHGKRLTNRRKQRLKESEVDQLDLKALSGIVYWMELCESCWEECSTSPAVGFPQEVWENLLRCPSVENSVPGEMKNNVGRVKVGR